MKRSLQGMYLLIFMLSIAVILFSSLMFYAEQTISTFDEETELWIYNEDRTER
jgi:hypothetical protein